MLSSIHRRERIIALAVKLEQASRILRSQADQGALRWIKNAEGQLIQAVKWVDDHTRHEYIAKTKRKGPTGTSSYSKCHGIYTCWKGESTRDVGIVHLNLNYLYILSNDMTTRPLRFNF
jgi:hypothetical protein